MAVLHSLTFESNTISGNADSFDSIVGSITVASASAIKGTYYADVGAATAYGKKTLTLIDEIYISLYVRINATTGSTGRILELRTSGGSASIVSVRYTNGGEIRAYNAAGASISAGLPVTLGTIYRVGFRYKKGTGANGIVELWAATGDAALTQYTNSTTNPDTVQVGEVRVGSTTSTFINFEFDDLIFDSASMPPASTGSTQIEKTYTLAASFLATLEKTYTIVASFQSTLEKTYIVVASFSNTFEKTYTLSASFLGANEKPYTLSASFFALLTKDYTVTASFAHVVEKTYTLSASFRIVPEKTYTLAASFLVTLSKEYTLGASFAIPSSQIEKAYAITASFSQLVLHETNYAIRASFQATLTKTYTISASFANPPAKIEFAVQSQSTESIVYLCDEFGQGALALPVIRASYTGVVNGIGSCAITLPHTFPLELLREDCHIEFWRSFNGSPLYCDMDQVFLLQRVEYALNGMNTIEITGPSIKTILERPIAYGKNTAYTNKTMAADSMMVEIVKENLSSSAADTSRRITTSYLTVKNALGSGASFNYEFAQQQVLSTLIEIAKRSEQAGTRVYFDLVRVSAGVVEFRTYVGTRGIDRSRNGSQLLLLTEESGNLQNVTLAVDYSTRKTFVYALGAGSGDNRLIGGFADTAFIKALPFGRKEAIIDGKSATTPTALVNIAKTEIERLRPVLKMTADIVSQPNAPYGVWRLGDSIEAQAGAFEQSMIITGVTVSIEDGIEKAVKGTARSIEIL